MESREGYVILTRSYDDDSCCMLVSCNWGNDYEPDDDWYCSLDTPLYSLYQGVDVRWAYHDLSTDQSNRPEWTRKTATVLLPR